MIEFSNLSNEIPYKIFKEKYDESFNAKQDQIEAISIASFSKDRDEVDSRFVNLKIISGKEFIFFSNYNSPKAKEFNTHEQIAAVIYWSSTNTQIRMKAKIKKTSKEFNNSYFQDRDFKKNALAISSQQSYRINSYEDVISNYEKSIRLDDLKACPDYWGGFSFIPYYFEFWNGHESRLNKRIVFELKSKNWSKYLIQP